MHSTTIIAATSQRTSVTRTWMESYEVLTDISLNQDGSNTVVYGLKGLSKEI